MRTDLEVHAFEREGEISISWLYNKDLFDRWRMEQMARHYVRVLEAVIADAERPVSEVDVLGKEERHRLLEEWNATARAVPEATLTKLFEQQVERTPEAVAVVCGEERLSYAELNARANRLAHYLIDLGVGPEDIVGLAMPRSVEMLASLLGILKAGAAYLPLDPDYPGERLRFMMEDTRPVCVITVSEVAPTLPDDWPHVVLDSPELTEALRQSFIGNPKDAERNQPLRLQNPAYVIYTSGSTGKPKGVVVTHVGIANLAIAQIECFQVTAEARVLQFASLSFDAALWEVAMALGSGAALVAIERGEQRSGEGLRDALLAHGITHITLPPTVLGMLPEGETLGLKALIVAGEACPPELAGKWSRGQRMINAYGPSEVTVCATVSDALSGTGVVPLGRPLNNTRVYVLNERLEPVPAGVGGELYIAGAGLARGYLRRPGQTGERFVADPYGKPGTRMYRTGDLARWREDGNLEFLGRSDYQVKVRGFRIELGEIEAALREQEGVREAVVVAQEEESGEKRLIGYVVCEAGARVDVKRMRARLAESLPEYMVPGAVMVLEALPLTANGKLDRKALPAPEWRGESYRLPRTPEEEILCSVFAELLGVEQVGLDDDFFALGGHSLLAVSLVSRVRALLDLEIGIETLFEAPTVGQLSARLHEAGRRREELRPQARPERLPLSYAQRRLWFLDRLQAGSGTEYNQPRAQRLRGDLDVEALERAVQTIVDRHESLRTHFKETDGEPEQVIEPEVQIDIPVEDLSGLEEREQRERVAVVMREEGREPFDLGRGPVLRMKLLKLGEREHVLLQTTHHIVSDGWSDAVFNRELMVLYEAYREGREDPLPPLPVQYADFALWQRKWLDEGALDEGVKYWKEQLAGIPERLELPTDRTRPAVQTYAAEACRVVLTEEQTAGLKRLSQQNQATLYMTLLAALGVLLARYSGQDDIVVGSPIANRQDAQLEELIGFFLNTLVLRMRVRPEMRFRELLEEVRGTALNAYRYQDIPFEKLVEELKPERSLNNSPLCQVVFALQNTPWGKRELKGLDAEPLAGSDLRVRTDLEVHAFEREGEISISWLYNKDLFDRWRMEQMARHYVRVLEAVIADAERPVSEVDVLGKEERHRLLEEWNATARAVPEATLTKLFEQQVERTPEAVAVVCGEERLSYAELNARANRLAHYLIDLGVGPEDIVGLAMPRSVEMLASLLGILKAGAAYLPLDPDYPGERLRFMMEDTRPVCVITVSEVAPTLPDDWPHVVLDSPELTEALRQSFIGNPKDAERNQPLRLQNPAYVIYTSGSTGKPKGVVVTHVGIANLAIAQIECFQVTAEARVLQFASLSFDAALWEVAMALGSGAALVAIERGEQRSGEGLRDALLAHGITHITLPPTVLGMLPEGETLGLKALIVAGEACPPELAGKWSRGQRMINAYGPSEVTVCATVSDALSGTGVVPLGRPLNNTRVYVLNERLEPVPAGVGGELYIAGAGLARGYLRRPGQTGERFVADPYGKPGTRMYRTGDLARWREDGNLEFLGRSDYQVKVRGFRIELGEIEAALREQEGVREAVVVAQEEESGEKRLIGYVVCEAGARVDVKRMRARLAESLPEYMVPGAVMVLEALPLTANGKLDRKALPAPEWRGESYRLPRTPEEEILCSVFAELLGVEQVGLDDDFFALGGHSLLAVRLLSRIRRVLNLELFIRTLFEAPTVGQLSARLHEAGRRREELRPQARPERLPLSYAQRRLWFLDRLQAGSGTEYNQPRAQRLRGDLDVEALERAVQTIVDRHESLRTHFKETDGEPEQVIEPEVQIDIPVEDLSGLEEREQRERVAVVMREEGREPFDLGRGPVLRMKLLKLGEREHVLLQTTHHIVSDGWSDAVFNRELMVLYEAYREGREDPLPPLPVQYADFALWQRKWLDEGALDEGVKYWKEQLAGIPERLELPTDRTRPAVQTYAAEACRVVLTEEQTAGLKRLSQQNQATLYMTLLAALGVLLARYSGQDDIVVGSPIANRQDAQLEELIGFFVNTLVLRVRVRPEMRFRELLEEVRGTALNAYRYQDIPFEKLVEELKPERSLNNSPLYQVVFALQNTSWGKRELKGLDAEPLAGSDLRVRTDLEVHAFEREGEISISWLYNKDLFDRWRMEQMARHYVRVLEAVIADAERPVSEVDVLGKEERHRLLEEWNATARAVPEATLTKLFEQQVERTPEAVAVVCGEERLSYAELNARANRLAHYLIDLGVGPEDIVGLAMPRSVEMLASLLGILKAGAAYLPLDPDYPGERLRFMMEDSEAKVVLSIEKMGLPTMPAAVRVDVDDLLLVGGEADDPDVLLDDEALAYIMYTSGSTGRPKGVTVPHRAIIRLVRAEYAQFESSDHVAFAANPAFDATTMEVWAPLLSGACIVVIDQDVLLEPVQLAQTLEREGVNVLWLTVGLFNQYADVLSEVIASLRYLVIGGDALDPRIVAETLQRNPPQHLLNGYGPTESTTFATTYEITHVLENVQSIPIGKPISNTRVYVLNERLEPVPAGVGGELYIAGAGLARGYLRRPGQTGERFVADPYGKPGTRMYRTGDLARWREDGNLEFLGKNDQHICTQLATALLSEPSIDDCFVLSRKTQLNSEELVAYIVSSSPWNPAHLHEHVKHTLPEFQREVNYVGVTNIPLARTGDVDVAALVALTILDSAIGSKWTKELLSRLTQSSVAVFLQENQPNGMIRTTAKRKHANDIATQQNLRVHLDYAEKSQRPAETTNLITRGTKWTISNLATAFQKSATSAALKTITYVGTDGYTRTQRYSDLFLESLRILHGMRSCGIPIAGEVVIQLRQNDDFIPAFWACILGGYVPVPLSLPKTNDYSNSEAIKLLGIVETLQHPIILSERCLLSSLKDMLRSYSLGDITLLDLDILRRYDPISDIHNSQSDELAILMATSGSSGTPKVVTLTHDNILSMVSGLTALNSISEQDVSLNWMPLDHVGGLLFFHVRDVILGSKQIQIMPQHILESPLRWFDYANLYKATVTWAPNFAYGLINEQEDELINKKWDLKNLRLILNGGEAIVAPTARKFLALMSRFNLAGNSMRPAWGMSETSSGVVFSDTFDRDHPSSTFVDLGVPIPGVCLRIVDAAGNVLSEKQIGNLEVRGSVVTRGYYRREDLNAEAFRNGGWFKTGDLGFLLNGRLTITGRSKEVIIVNGVNYAAHEIESLLEGIPEVEASFTVACAVRSMTSDTDQLAIVFSPRSVENKSLGMLLRKIRSLLFDSFGITPRYLVPLPNNQIPKTSAGKIQRTALRELLERGSFDDVLEKVDTLLGEDKGLPNWFFRRVWVSKAPIVSRLLSVRKSGVVFAGRDKVASRLIGELAADFHREWIIVEAGTQFVMRDRLHFQINQSSESDYRKLFEHLAHDHFPICDILYLEDYSTPSQNPSGCEVPQHKPQWDAYGMLLLLKTLSEPQRVGTPYQLLCAVTTKFDVLGEDVAYESWATAGLLRAAQREIPHATCKCLYIEEDDLSANVKAILEELRITDRESEVVYRRRQRFVSRLERIDLGACRANESPIKMYGTYVVAGGLGGIGVEVCKLLLKQYKARLLVIGKTRLPDRDDQSFLNLQHDAAERIKAFQSLETIGGQVEYEAVDICDVHKLQCAVSRVMSKWNCELDGVFHLAGGFAEHVIAEENNPNLRAMLQPKAHGAWALSTLLKDKNDGLFVAFSSVNGVMGGTGVSAYAAANSALIQFCDMLRKTTPFNVRCFIWSGWHNTGMSRKYKSHDASRASGYLEINIEQGLDSFIAGMCLPEPHIIIGLDAMNPQVRRYLIDGTETRFGLYAYIAPPSKVPMGEELNNIEIMDKFGVRTKCRVIELSSIPTTGDGSVDSVELGRMLAEHDSESQHFAAPRNQLEERILKIWRDVLGNPNLGITGNFFYLGGHSLLGMQAVSRINNVFHTKLPLRRLFEAPTVEQMALIVEEAVVNEISQISEDEAVRLVAMRPKS